MGRIRHGDNQQEQDQCLLLSIQGKNEGAFQSNTAYNEDSLKPQNIGQSLRTGRVSYLYPTT